MPTAKATASFESATEAICCVIEPLAYYCRRREPMPCISSSVALSICVCFRGGLLRCRTACLGQAGACGDFYVCELDDFGLPE